MRKFRRLELERYYIAMFPLNWTIVHPIDEDSPLWGRNKEDLTKMDVEFIVVLKGYDDTFAQTVNVHHSYKYDEMVVGAKFKPMYYVSKTGETILEVDKINEHERVALASTVQ